MPYPVAAVRGKNFGRSAWTPQTESGLANWQKFDDLTTLFQDSAGTTPVASDGDVIGLITDLSGNGRDFSQGTTAKKPTWKTNQINGNAVARFDGADDLLENLTNFLSSSEGAVFAVFDLNATIKDQQVLFSSGDNLSTIRFWLCKAYETAANPRLNIAQKNNDTDDAVRGDTTIAINTTYAVIWFSSGTEYSIWVNGNDEILTAFSGADNGDWLADTSARDHFAIGCMKRSDEILHFRGDLLEIGQYDHNLTGAALTNLKNYLAGRGGVSI